MHTARHLPNTAERRDHMGTAGLPRTRRRHTADTAPGFSSLPLPARERSTGYLYLYQRCTPIIPCTHTHSPPRAAPPCPHSPPAPPPPASDPFRAGGAGCVRRAAGGGRGAERPLLSTSRGAEPAGSAGTTPAAAPQAGGGRMRRGREERRLLRPTECAAPRYAHPITSSVAVRWEA